MRIEKKKEKFENNNKSKKDLLIMTRSVNYKTSKKTNTSIIAQLNNQHKKRRQRVGNIKCHYSMFNVYSTTQYRSKQT